MKIGVLGLGLIGGSIFKNLIGQGFDVVGVSASQNGENITSDWSILKSCEIVFVCTPMNKCLETLDKLEEILPPSTIVTDVCSLKCFVCKKARSYKFIPSHPMAGTEKKGFENSFPAMFSGAKWVLTPVYGNDGVDILTDLINKMGAEIIITTPDKHDEAAALISHMPLVIAQALYLTASDNELALKMASSGFRDMTRLALSNEEMAVDMFNMNSKNIETAILKLYKSVGELTKENYPKKIAEIKQKRSKMFSC